MEELTGEMGCQLLSRRSSSIVPASLVTGVVLVTLRGPFASCGHLSGQSNNRSSLPESLEPQEGHSKRDEAKSKGELTHLWTWV